MGRRSRARFDWRVLAVLGAVLASLSFGTTAQAGRHRELTVMTQNLYLGSSLQPAIEAETLPEFVGAVALIYGTAVFTDFPARAEVIADEIARPESPTSSRYRRCRTWTARRRRCGRGPSAAELRLPRHPPGRTGRTRPLLRGGGGVAERRDRSCAARRGAIRVRHVVPSAAVSLADRDVILVNTATPALHWRNGTSGRYDAQASFAPGPAGTLSFDRGWASIDVKYRGRSFLFVNTHLEVEDFEAVQEAQAVELLEGPLATAEDAVVAGDFNSAADGSTTDTYEILTSTLVDVWVGTGWRDVLPERHAHEPRVSAGDPHRPHPDERRRVGLRRRGARRWAVVAASAAVGLRSRRRGRPGTPQLIVVPGSLHAPA